MGIGESMLFSIIVPVYKVENVQADFLTRIMIIN